MSGEAGLNIQNVPKHVEVENKLDPGSPLTLVIPLIGYLALQPKKSLVTLVTVPVSANFM